jgi:dihydrofolate reductase
MRKLKLQVQMSIDGFISGTNGEMDWMAFNWSDDLIQFVTQITDPVDTILLGRKLAEGFIPHWTAAFNSPEPAPGSEKYVKTPKVVFTKTLTTSEWDNTVLAKGDLVEEVNALKNQKGGDIIAYGGGQFVAHLIKESLIDELNLFINPTAIGSGMAIFNQRTNLKLVKSQAYECGIVVNTYQPLK